VRGGGEVGGGVVEVGWQRWLRYFHHLGPPRLWGGWQGRVGCGGAHLPPRGILRGRRAHTALCVDVRTVALRCTRHTAFGCDSCDGTHTHARARAMRMRMCGVPCCVAGSTGRPGETQTVSTVAEAVDLIRAQWPVPSAVRGFSRRARVGRLRHGLIVKLFHWSS
jgi:hypothetical protein